MAAVTALEHGRMRPGEVAQALVAWQAAVFMGTADHVEVICMCPECSGDAPRWRLQRALTALPPWARPHLGALILPLDRYFLSRTSPDLQAPPHLPWWQRRRAF